MLQLIRKLAEGAPSEPAETSSTGATMTRRGALAALGTGGLTLALAACGDDANDKTPTGAATTPAPASGSKGGPKGWDGAERYQYTADSAPGRAVEAAKKLKAEGKAPETLVVGMYAGSVGNYTQPFPKGAKSVVDVWEEETGIKIKFVSIDPAQAYAKATQQAATKDGSLNIVLLGMADVGDLAEAGLLLDLSEYVDRHQPDWNDPKWGYAGGEQITHLFNYYNGKPYAVASDGDFNMWIGRRDLFEDAKEQRDFKAKYGYDLKYPQTWSQQRDMAEFFHRPDQGLLGSTDLRAPAWGWINFVTRYSSTGNPVQMYWDDEMRPLIAGEEGVKALKHLVETTKFGSKDALSWTWEQQYANWGKRGAAMSNSFNNLTKFMKKGSPLDPKDSGAVTQAFNAPGWDVGGTIVRHSSIYFNQASAVNAFSPSKYHEAAYVFLQWVASGPIYTWLTANPGGYQDPCKIACLEDPLVSESYTPRTIEALKGIIPGTAPSIAGLAGANEYIQALDVNLQKALSGQSSPEKALEEVAKAWDKTTDKLGRDKQAAAWKAQRPAWPTKADTTTV